MTLNTRSCKTIRSGEHQVLGHAISVDARRSRLRNRQIPLCQYGREHGRNWHETNTTSSPDDPLRGVWAATPESWRPDMRIHLRKMRMVQWAGPIAECDSELEWNPREPDTLSLQNQSQSNWWFSEDVLEHKNCTHRLHVDVLRLLVTLFVPLSLPSVALRQSSSSRRCCMRWLLTHHFTMKHSGVIGRRAVSHFCIHTCVLILLYAFV